MFKINSIRFAMASIIMSIGATLLYSAAATVTALEGTGCGKFIPRKACVCDAVWRDTTCPHEPGVSAQVDTSIFLVPCPKGLEPSGDGGVSLIRRSDIDFPKMSESTKDQVMAWTGMTLNKTSTPGSYIGDFDPISGHNSFLNVLGCAIVNLEPDEKPDSVKKWWKFGVIKKPGSKPPPSPDGGMSPTDVCEPLVIDDNTMTVTVPQGCTVVDVDISQTHCEMGGCTSSPGDGLCILCAKDNCCIEVQSCLADIECHAYLNCLQSSANCETNNNLSIALNTCFTNACNNGPYSCTEIGMQGMCLGQQGTSCNTTTLPCCSGMSCQGGVCNSCNKSGDTCLTSQICCSGTCSETVCQ